MPPFFLQSKAIILLIRNIILNKTLLIAMKAFLLGANKVEQFNDNNISLIYKTSQYQHFLILYFLEIEC